MTINETVYTPDDAHTTRLMRKSIFFRPFIRQPQQHASKETLVRIVLHPRLRKSIMIEIWYIGQ